MDNPSQIRDLFSRFFNPGIRRKTLYENVQSLPTPRDFDEYALERLESLKLIEYLSDRSYVLPKPLGILAVEFEDKIPEEELVLLIDQYHKQAESKLQATLKYFGKTKKLPFKQMAPIVFLLYNNNISKYLGYFEKNSELKDAIDRINSAFAHQDSNSQGTKDLDAALSGYYLTEANRKLGLPIYNKEPYYYIQPNRIQDVEEAIRESIKQDPKKAKASFKEFEKAFEKESRILFENGALYATPSSRERVKKLFVEVSN